MKKRLSIRNRRGVAGRGVGFSLFIVITVSTLLGFVAQTIQPTTVSAAADENILKFRYLTYFDKCLNKYLDADAKANDGNGRNPEFESMAEMWKPGEIVAVGNDLEGTNGVMTCLTIAKNAAPYIQNDKPWDEWLSLKIWGKTFDGDKIKASGEQSGSKNTARAKKLRGEIAPLIEQAKKSRTKVDTLERMKPLFDVCFDKLQTTKPTTEVWKEGSIKFEKRKIYARATSFDWDDSEIKSLIKIRSSYGRAIVGDIALPFSTLGASGSSEFDDRTKQWFPVGADLKTPLGGGVISSVGDNGTLQGGGHATDEMVAGCDVFLKLDTYFFGTGPNDSNTRWLVRNNKLQIYQDLNGNGKVDDEEVTDAAGVTNGGGGSTQTNNREEGEDTNCRVEGALGWILAPICKAALAATEKVGEYVTDALQIPLVTQSNKNGTVYSAWRSFRDIANSLLVLLFLIAIFYQVLPIEVDAYTIKKVLPRLIMAAIAIQASFFICQVLIDISNVLGGGVQSIFQAIGSGAAGTTSENVDMVNTSLTAIVGVPIIIGFIGPVFFLLVAAVVSIITMIISIQAREVIIIFLVLVSPIAFLAGVLPNTDSWFKKWGSNFIKLLLMYPLIQFILSGSYMISKVLNVEGTSGIQQVMLSTIPVIALFMIPAAFKASGTLMSAVGGAINSKGFGMSKGLVGKAKTDAKDINRERGATLMGSDSRFKRGIGRLRTGNVGFGDRTQRKIRSAINKNYSEMSESVQDKYQSMSNAERYKEYKKLQKSRSAKDQLEAVALGNMIAANSGGPEMGKLFDALEGYEFNADGSYKKDAAGNLVNNAKEVIVRNADGSIKTITRGKVTRDGNGAVVSVADRGWNEIAKRNSAFLASAVPHSVSKPASQAGAAQLIGGKGAGFGEEIREQALRMQTDLSSADKGKRDKAAAGLQKLANQFVAAAQREDASDMQASTIDAFQALAGSGAFDGVNFSFKGTVAGQDLSVLAPADQMREFIRLTTQGGSLARTVQG